MLKERFFDFEVFAHWWCCVIGDNDEDLSTNAKNNFKVITSDDRNCRDTLLMTLKEKGYVVFGYNIKSYDLIILNAIYNGFVPEQVKIINDIIINPSCMYSTKEHARLSSFAKRRFNSLVYQDLMDDNDKSLKDKEMSLGLDIMESSVPFDKEDLTDADKEDIIKYCKQDVYATMYYYNKVCKQYVNTKLMLGKTFNIDEDTCYKCTNPKLTGKTLQAVRKSFADSEEIIIELPEKIKNYCIENVPEHILKHLLTSTEQLSTRAFGNDITYGNGGIHSTYASNLYVESDETYSLFNVDADSYYPSVMIQFGTLSRCAANSEIFKNIFDRRMSIKHNKNRTSEEEDIQKALKLILNSTFGASGNKYLDLFDPYQTTRTCRIGQIFLTALACKLHREVPTLNIIQGNTDGLLVYCKRDYLDKVAELMREWSNISGINMEREEVKCIWQRDVNNYLMIEENGKIKNKGAWLMDTQYKKGLIKMGPLDAFVCTKAAQAWLLEGKNIIETIINCKNLEDFAISCTKGPTYSGVIHRYANGKEVPLYKANRIYATKDTSLGRLYKIKRLKDRISYTQMPSTPEHCKLINNDLSTYNFDEIKKDIDYLYYVERCTDILNIPWVNVDNERITKFDIDFI